MTKAIQQAKKPEPNKKSIMEHLNNTKSVLESITAASGILKGLNQVIKLVTSLF